MWIRKKTIAYELIYGQQCNHKIQSNYKNELLTFE